MLLFFSVRISCSQLCLSRYDCVCVCVCVSTVFIVCIHSCLWSWLWDSVRSERGNLSHSTDTHRPHGGAPSSRCGYWRRRAREKRDRAGLVSLLLRVNGLTYSMTTIYYRKRAGFWGWHLLFCFSLRSLLSFTHNIKCKISCIVFHNLINVLYS